jgi:hypothetical protein
VSTATDPAAEIAICLEVGSKRVFASALDWPGWCRAGKNEAQALAALEVYAPRYAPVAREAGLALPATPLAFEVVERLRGSAVTDFGVPVAIAERDAAPLAPDEAERLGALVGAAWAYLDRVVTRAPAELRKGPRGGGRDRDHVFAHVVEAEGGSYARKLGIRKAGSLADDPAAVASLRAAILAALRAGASGEPLVERGWPVRYAARRIAWHVLDHAWEIEDRSE